MAGLLLQLAGVTAGLVGFVLEGHPWSTGFWFLAAGWALLDLRVLYGLLEKT